VAGILEHCIQPSDSIKADNLLTTVNVIIVDVLIHGTVCRARKFIFETRSSEFSSSDGGDYEAQNLLGCTAVFLIECRPTFQRYVLPSSSVALTMEAACSSATSVDIQLRTRQYIPENSELHTRRRKNLKSHIVNLCGEATLRCIRRFETLRIKKAKRLCPLYFLLRCRDQGTISRFLQFHHHIHSEAASHRPDDGGSTYL
jgi:hypothetical protein